VTAQKRQLIQERLEQLSPVAADVTRAVRLLVGRIETMDVWDEAERELKRDEAEECLRIALRQQSQLEQVLAKLGDLLGSSD
jgi:hypothetical protein